MPKLKLLQVTVFPLTAHNADDAPVLKVSPDGTTSETTTLHAVFGPAFVTVIVYDATLPATTDEGPVFAIERSTPFGRQYPFWQVSGFVQSLFVAQRHVLDCVAAGQMLCSSLSCFELHPGSDG